MTETLCELFGWPVIYPGVFNYHEVFHLFVLAANYCFFVFVLRHVVDAEPSLPTPALTGAIAPV